MSSVQYLAGFHCPAADLSTSKAQVISGRQTFYVTTGSKFVYRYDTKKKLTVAAFLFPAKVCQIELVSSTQQLYVLCAKNGIYLLELDKQGRCLKEPGSSSSAGRMNVVSVGPESCCLYDPSVCSIAVAHDVLVTVSKYPDKWGIKLRPMNGKPPSMAPLREIELSFRPSPGDIKGMEHAFLQPVLCCVCLWKEKEPSCDPCHLALEASLFTSLFGVDCTLLSCPIIFCGFPDGQVACFPLNAAGFSRPVNQEQPLVPVKVLYHLEQPVVFIGATKAEFQSSNTAHSAESAERLASDCILFIGRGGLLVTITHLANTQGSAYEFREYHLQAPVSCAASASSCIYYSTCTDLLSVAVPPAQKEVASRTPQNPILPSTSHNITLVVAVSLVSTQGDIELLALSNRGRLMLCKLCQREKGAQVGVLCTNMGKRIKTLLSGIGTISDRVSKLRTVLDQKTTSLLTLNQVMTLSRVVLSSHLAEPPVHCEIKVSQTSILQQKRFMASCILKNNSDCVLDRGWILCVYLCSEGSDSSISYSFPIRRLPPGETTELCFPLPADSCEKLRFPIKVSCTLFYSFRNITTGLGNSDNNADPFVPHKQGICLPLQELIIDFLHCVQVNPKAGLPFTPAAPQVLSWDPVESFLLSSPRGKGGIKKWNHLPEDICSLRVNYAAQLKATVRVSSLLISQALQNEKSGVSVCCAVLRWLFPERWTGTENQEEVHGVTPDGRALGLRVRKVSVGDLPETIPAIDIEITSPHLDALACLHMAVIRRLKTLVLQHKRNDGNVPELKLRNIQEQFIARKSLLKEVQALRDRLCVQKELNLDTILHRLLDTYRALRHPGLPFI
ncbi:Fanconi anemia core complex-associated protein 100 [Spea bombifrons]|uniref:Fanconi anemia core complex-associated protein 100 n=1 Tax=Spea bombifrons TaxID=233779 RepID=UPI00234B6D63|nr:Fanconi anemia core complex-associated protein 100 [Spea bombifrons]